MSPEKVASQLVQHLEQKGQQSPFDSESVADTHVQTGGSDA
jgi:hypothetical protein